MGPAPTSRIIQVTAALVGTHAQQVTIAVVEPALTSRTLPCAEGEACCNGACTNLNNNPSNCGACGNTCASGLTCCNGACTDLQNTPGNCGTCGNTCAEGEACSSGACICTIFPGFQAQATFGTGTTPYDVGVGDFNGDGYLDIVAANANQFSVSVLLGTGSGNFQPQATFGTGDWKCWWKYSERLTRDWVWELPAADHIPVGNGPFGVAVGDFNGDGYLDIVTANNGGNSVSVLLGTGSGSFQPQATFPWGSIHDVSHGGSTVSVLLGTGSGSFQPQTTFPVGNGPFGVAVGDFNGDGYLDIVTGNVTADHIPVGNGPFGVAVGDFNGDGYLDIVTANNGGISVSVLLGTGSGSFQPQATFPVGSSPLGVAVGHFNGDGYLDIVATNAGGNTVSILLGKPCDT
ncbi:hypothetical protein N7481_002915 [Penicillium waksmanii]|uniref:uncharacterized protein n=1 Tax=Penicillium waksmanii TaxID=69791 RepID=UPI0025492AA5|nr:uncharacterized protein N7481_002915 [Penicillium waksmanii]KAJ5987705.1 hypothetical protein N7481_002915 [Penicillium waksmanii]